MSLWPGSSVACCADRYFGLDPIKWAMMYILNEDGFRDLASHKVQLAVSMCDLAARSTSVWSVVGH
jgi:hypothetical protein